MVEILDARAVLDAEKQWFLKDAQEETKRWKAAGDKTPAPATKPDELVLSALCLSGGGIRSAAFCLGVIQAFAARGMLRQFHYLSTVSGGGYIGGWLTRCIAAWNNDPSKDPPDDTLEKVEKHLNVYKAPEPPPGVLLRADRWEPPELRQLRRFTNFLTPSPGVASTDTWAGIMLWLRNTLINWAVFSPLFAAIAGVPVFYFAMICLSGCWGEEPVSRWVAFSVFGIISLFCIGFTNVQVCLCLPTHWKLDDPAKQTDPPGFGLAAREIFWRIGFCSLLWTFVAPLAVAPLLAPLEPAAGVQAAFWDKPSPPPADPAAAQPACPAAPKPTCPAAQPPNPACPAAQPPNPACPAAATPTCPPAPPKIPRLVTLVPSWLQPVMSEPFLRERSALCILPILLWITYQLAFEIARCRVAKQYKTDFKAARADYYTAMRKAAADAVKAAAGTAAQKASQKEVWKKQAKALRKQARDAHGLLRQNEKAFTDNRGPWMAGGVVAALVICGGLRLDYGHSALWLALAGPLWLTGAELIRSAVFVALRRGGIYSDLDREWLARISGDKLRVALAVTALGTCAVFLPRLIFDHFNDTYQRIGAVLAFFGSGSVGAILGQSVRTVFTHGVKPADTSFWTTDRLIKLCGALFAVLLFTFAGRVVIITACVLDHVPLVFPSDAAGSGKVHVGAFLPLVLMLTGIVIEFAALAVIIDYSVNLNRFSMHAVYRNRIIRAFLGTARATARGQTPEQLQAEGHQEVRLPNRYTGFGAKDNMRMAGAEDRHPRRLFPVINTTLNRTTGMDTARAARKGEPFTITPLHCGSPSLNRWDGAYVKTGEYAGGDKEFGIQDEANGISLGTAMAISGAAVSPNMGYNSSPFMAFLMTLFNVRLGAWLPNPAYSFKKNEPAEEQRAFFQYPGPRMAIPTLYDEMTGQSDDTGKYVYLSDGGHFDNLGLYEMLRRRCEYIFVVDAGADEGYKYFDLGHTLEMALIDLGVQIDFAPPLACKVEKLMPAAAYATITYPADSKAGLSEGTGQLIYLKPWLPEEAPIELLSYKEVKSNFPHEPTEDQFFTESDFESYRRLGEFLTNNMMNKLHVGRQPQLASLFSQASLVSKAPVPPSPQPKQSPQPLSKKP